ncbi:alpha/beta fold hydrolase [Asaia lannensis]|uniref:Lipase family protein n=1 Tax=Asaia lannensis NBRC 102526 TaxID=1307926 RepID=A0ABT1CD96_9PROT|nr:alpha/beta fold hydrolase [Asaia lannensis]MCO6158823.1 lipase family protein [Asaia lannensis NBRC 102526]GBR00148.1 hypothetical protein AA102526_2054 [Asaia lannensis NBRC 102526]
MRSALAMMAISALTLTACAMDADEDAESRYAPVAAGQAIKLEQKNAPIPGTAYRMAYRSTDAHDPTHLVAVSAEVMLPRGTPPAGGWPVMAWAHGTSGIGLTCAPSIMGIGGPQASFYGSWLRRGYAVVATDYPGLGEPGAALYLNAKSEGMAVLDSVRAARRRFSSLSGHVVLLGHDQGAQAVLAASALARSYAPSLQIKGTIALGAPYFDGDSGHILTQSHGARRFAPGVVYGLLLGASLGKADPSFDPSSAFKPRALPLYRKASELCRGDFFGAVEHAGLTPDNTFQPDAENALAPALQWARYPSLKLSSPVMLGIASNDTQVPPAQQEKLKQALCSAGTVVSVHHYRVEHSPLLNAAESEAQAFADRSLQGDAISSDCQ